MELGIKKKIVLITACSQGIGEQIAINFAKEGASCYLVSRNKKKLSILKKKLDKFSKNNLIFPHDLKSDEDLKIFFSNIKNLKTPDFIVNNIGGTLDKKSAMSDYYDWQKVINFNVGISIKLNNFFIPKMLKKKTSCKIVHISSISAISLRGSAPYAASKTFLNSYLTTLARELGETNIVVSGIMPGALFAKGGHWDRVKNKSYENERFFETPSCYR